MFRTGVTQQQIATTLGIAKLNFTKMLQGVTKE
jgi:hypothetical protein